MDVEDPGLSVESFRGYITLYVQYSPEIWYILASFLR